MKLRGSFLCLAWVIMVPALLPIGIPADPGRVIEVAPIDNREPLISTSWENDVFFFTDPELNKDRGYTQASLFVLPDKQETLPYFRLMDIFNAWRCPDDADSCADKRFRLTGKNYLMGQNLYTPEDKLDTGIILKDRPYAAFLFFGKNFKYSPGLDSGLGMPRWQWTNRHLFGSLGRWALGEDTQNWVHRNVSGSPEALGWAHQIRPQLVYQFNSQLDYLAWTHKFRKNSSLHNLELVLNGNAGVGLIFRGANVGGTLRVGIFHPSFFGFGNDISMGEKLRPDGMRYDPRSWSRWLWVLNPHEGFLVFGAKGIWTLSNRMLQGGDFHESNPHTVEPEALVHEFNWGAGLNFTLARRINTDFALINTFRANEFEGGRKGHYYGGFNLSFSWIVDRVYGPRFADRRSPAKFPDVTSDPAAKSDTIRIPDPANPIPVNPDEQ